MGFALLALEDGQQGLADWRLGLVSEYFLGIFRSRDVTKGGRDIDDVPDLGGHTWFDHAWPMGNEGGADAALVIRRLEFPVRRVAGIGPGDGDGPVAFNGAGRNVRRGVGLFGAGPVVGQEHDEGVVPFAQFPELGKKATEVLVNAVDHGRVDGHLQVLPIFLLISEIVPRPGGAGGKFVVWADDAHLVHARKALFADLIPANSVFAAVFCDVPGPGVQRVMGGSVGEVENEGFVLVLVFIKAIDRVSGEGIGMVELLVRAGVAHDHLVLDGPAPHPRLAFSPWRPLAGASLEAGVEKVAAPVGQPVVAIEAPGRGQRLLVPLAGDKRAVADGA